MFFICELKKLRKLKNALLARHRCEQVLAALPDQLEYKIANCKEVAEIKAAQEKLNKAKELDAFTRRKNLANATLLAAIISLIVTAAVSFLVLALQLLPAIVVVLGGTALVTLLVHLIAKAKIKKRPAKNQLEIDTCEQALAQAKADYEVAKALLTAEYQARVAFYENLLNNPSTGIIAAIKRNPVVHDDDKNYNTVSQIIWCFEHKYARSVKEAKKWIATSKHDRYVRERLVEINDAAQREKIVACNAKEGAIYTEKLPVAAPAPAPVAEAPVEAPAQKKSAVEAPAKKAPVVEVPVVEVPVVEEPVVEVPVVEEPVVEVPVVEAPVEEAPIEETPVEEVPVEETPVEEAPIEEAPVEETPVEEAPAEEAPVEETPAEEAPEEQPKKKSKSLILGIVGFALTCCFPPAAHIVSIIGIVFGIKEVKANQGKAGLIVSAAAEAFAAFCSILAIILVAAFFKSI